jgi:hypothetical protein
MSPITEDTRTDIKEALTEVMFLMEAVRMGLELTMDKSSERDVKICIGALGRFIGEIDRVLGELEEVIESLTGDPEANSPDAAPAIAEALGFYADPLNYQQVRGKPSRIARDGGAKARKLQELLAGDAQ